MKYNSLIMLAFILSLSKDETKIARFYHRTRAGVLFPRGAFGG